MSQSQLFTRSKEKPPPEANVSPVFVHCLLFTRYIIFSTQQQKDNNIVIPESAIVIRFTFKGDIN